MDFEEFEVKKKKKESAKKQGPPSEANLTHSKHLIKEMKRKELEEE